MEIRKLEIYVHGTIYIHVYMEIYIYIYIYMDLHTYTYTWNLHGIVHNHYTRLNNE